MSAITALGRESAAVRLGGVVAITQLADDWPDQRQACIDVLCAYIRLPYQLLRGEEGWRYSEQEVRWSIIRAMRDHLRLQQDDPRTWQGRDLDFTGAVFDGGDFTGATFSRGSVSFVRATFSGGEVWFDGATFSGGSVSFAGAEFSNGVVSFDGGEFSDARVWFNEATFSGGKVSFNGAEFSGGKVSFNGAEFSGGEVSFNGATFSGATVSFLETRLDGGNLTFGNESLNNPPPQLALPDWLTPDPDLQSAGACDT